MPPNSWAGLRVPPVGLRGASSLRGTAVACTASPPARGQLVRGADGGVEPGCLATFQATIKRSDVEN